MANLLGFKKHVLMMVLFSLVTPLHASTKPKFILVPMTATTFNFEVPQNESAIVQYKVTNQTRLTRTLTTVDIPGIKQIRSGVGVCSRPFVLSQNQSCLLTLQINARELPINGVKRGPIVCKTQGPGDQSPNLLLCSQPGLSHSLSLTVKQNIQANNAPWSLRVNGTERQVTITNLSPTLEVTHIRPDFKGTALQGKVSLTANTCFKVAPLGTCTLGFTPASGQGPVPLTAFKIEGDNTTTLYPQMAILDLGSIWQEGLVFEINANGTEGKVAALQNAQNDVLDNEIYWDNSIFPTAVGGINELSTAGVNSCNGATDGACNTQRIVNELTGNLAININSYAAGICSVYSVNSNQVSPCTGAPGEVCYNDWYLPARDELNQLWLQTTFNQGPISGFDDNFYWSSTELSADQASQAWNQNFDNGFQISTLKKLSDFVRCIKAFHP